MSIEKEIQTQLAEAIHERQQLLESLKETEEKIRALTQARLCKHNFKETGGFMYATYHCKLCKFEFMDS